MVSGVLLWLAHPRVSIWPLAWIALAPLMVSIVQATRFRQAAWRGYLFGWAFLAPTWYWTGATIATWTHSPVGWLALFGLTVILALFYAGWSGAAWWLSQRLSGGMRIAAFAGTWVIMEWARTLGALTMPWAQLSYSQYRFLPIIQISEVTGAYGVSFLIVLVNAAVADWWINRGRPQSTRWIWATATLSVLICLFGLARLAEPENGKPLQIALMQSNFENETETAQVMLRELWTIKDLTNRAALHGPPFPVLYVWSESAAPGDALSSAYPTRSLLTRLAMETHGAILIGGRVVDSETQSETNSAVLFTPDGSPPARYDKQQLVPFGEYTPFGRDIPKWLDDIFHFVEDVRQGSGPTLLRYSDPAAGVISIGPFICYESLYPRYPREITHKGANLLITVSNDRWFNSQAAMEQHLSAVVLRAVENRRYVARSTTNGVTCLINSRGRVLGRAPFDQAAFMIVQAQRLEGQTLYTRFGDWFVAFSGLLVIGLVIGDHVARGQIRRRESKDDEKPESASTAGTTMAAGSAE